MSKALSEQNLKEVHYSKYYNSDLPLLEVNMTPFQFEQIETTHKSMLRLEREARQEEAPVEEAPLEDFSISISSEAEYYEPQLDEMDDIIKKVQRVESRPLPLDQINSSSALYEPLFNPEP